MCACALNGVCARGKCASAHAPDVFMFMFVTAKMCVFVVPKICVLYVCLCEVCLCFVRSVFICVCIPHKNVFVCVYEVCLCVSVSKVFVAVCVCLCEVCVCVLEDKANH